MISTYSKFYRFTTGNLYISMLTRYVQVILAVHGVKTVNCKQKLESEMIVDILARSMG